MNKKTSIGYKRQPKRTVIYRPCRSYKPDADKLKQEFDLYDEPISLTNLYALYDNYSHLIKAARCFRIKQTYLDGEYYWQLDLERKPFSFKSIGEL